MDLKQRGGLRLKPRTEQDLPADKRLPRQAAAGALGALYAAATLGEGVQPFGAAYAAVAGHPIPAAMGAFLCYVLRGGKSGLTCGAAVAVILTCRLVLDGTAAVSRRWFFPCCAMVALFCTKIVTTASLKEGLIVLCEAALCGGFSFLLGRAREKASPMAAWGRLTALLGALLALLPLRLGPFAPARALAALTVLCAAAFGGSAAGAAAGAVFGACMDLAQGQTPFYALILCMAGLLCGRVKQKGLRAAALCFCGAGGAVCLWYAGSDAAAGALMECFAAGAGFTLLPKALRERAEASFQGLRTEGLLPAGGGSGSASLAALSSAMGQLGTFWEGRGGSAPRDPGDLSTVYRAACETACRTCRGQPACWRADNGMRGMLADAGGTLRLRHQLESSDLPEWFRRQCLQPERFCGAVNDAYRESLRREARDRQDRAMQSVLTAQCDSLETLLRTAAGRAGAGAEYDPLLEERVRRVVRAYLPHAGVQVGLNGGRLSIDLLLPANGSVSSGDLEPMLRSLRGALGTSLLPPRPVPTAKGVCWRIVQRERFRLEVGSAILQKAGETVCGDSFRHFCTEDGRAIALLSDGMGTGAAAGALSRRTVELVSSFVRSGCSLADSTAAVLPVLAARFPEWGFVTLDLAEINLFTGQAALLKYGAATGFLLREGRLTRLNADALPAGLESPEKKVPSLRLRLKAGDRLVMLSDGAWEQSDPEALLREHGGMDGQALAELLVREAARASAGDDMTAVVATLHAGGAESA